MHLKYATIGEHMHTTLLVVRHGLVENPDDILYYRHVNVPLSTEGHKQMQKIGRQIRAQGINPQFLYTSPLRRAIQSSEEIAKSFPGIPIITEEDLQDPSAPGIQLKTNSWLAEIEKQGFDVYSHPEFINRIESREAVAKRMKHVIDAIREKHSGETVLVVSHGDTIALLREKLKNPHTQLPSITELKNNNTYPNKGEVWRVVLADNGAVVEDNIT